MQCKRQRMVARTVIVQMTKIRIHLNSKDKLADSILSLNRCGIDGAYEMTLTRLPQKRTDQQRKALYRYFNLLATALNDGGYDVQTVLAKAIGRDWDAEGVKSLLWKPLQVAITSKESTADADTKEYSIVYEKLDLHLCEIFGVHVPFPSKEKL